MAYAEKVYKVRGGKTTKQFTWRSRYKRPDGTWGSEPGFPTRKLAEEWGEVQETAVRNGRWVDPDLARKPFGVFAEEWMKAQRPRGQTTMNRRERLNATILPRWQHAPLNTINWFEVEAWARTLPCAHSTTRTCVGIMSRILTGAVDAQHLSVNLLYNRKLTGLTAETEGKRKTKPENMWAPPEVVLQMARRLGPTNGLLVMTTAFLGLRLEEVLGLRRCNTLLSRNQKHSGGLFTCPVVRVDKETGALVEYYTYDDDGRRSLFRGLEPPKNPQSARDVDVPPFLADRLRNHLAEQGHEHVFTAPRGGLWWRTAWQLRVRQAADGRQPAPGSRGAARVAAWDPIMPGLDMRALRHSHDTYQAEIGVKPVLAYEQAGHKYPGIKGTYQHPTPEMRRERLDGLQGLYERAMTSLGWEKIWEL
ncbi:hypothetical protein ABZ953_06430 [Streptomyces sp. NPDC046465]|uniref:hypothetical protein n=1 Tax=Streptomyces sp. NPDC046465 TaxID=3155810 RepID=UPI0033D27EEC